MSLWIGTALRDGARRTVTRDGLVLVCAFVLVGVVSTVAIQTLATDVFDSFLDVLRTGQPAGDPLSPQEIDSLETAIEAQTSLALSIPTSVAGLGIVCTGVIAEALHLIAVRIFFAAYTNGEIDRLRPIFLPTLNGVVGGVVVWFLITIGGILGLVVLVVGGPIVAAFLAVSFLFLRQEIAIENKGFIRALNDSWDLTRGNRIALFGLVLAVFVITGLASGVLSAVFGALSPVAGVVVGFLVGGVTAVFGTAVFTRAYARLHAEEYSDETDDRTPVY